MCGIAGRLAPHPLKDIRREHALARMANRGPDGQTCFTTKWTNQGTLDLLHSRLSILDLNSRSDQPFIKEGLTLVYNGEIYNFLELRQELRSLGHEFRTSGDTEVLLEAWRAWGVAALDRLTGMFAFAIFDAQRQQLVLARDRFGEKPFYIWEPCEGEFLFASEIKVLASLAGKVPDMDRVQLRRYLVNGYKGLMRDGRTFYENIRELPASHYLTIHSDGRKEESRYWTLRYAPEEMDAEEAQARTDTTMEQAVSRTLRADVPVAVRLSGGIDSNVVAGLAHHRCGADITCFSIIEKDWRYDESAMIGQALKALNVKNHQIHIPETGFLERLEDMIQYFDGPPLTISYYLHYLVSEAIHDAGFRLSLGGTGADEVFSGYYDHYLFWLADQQEDDAFESLVAEWQGTYGQFVRNPFLQNPRRFIDHPHARDHIFLGAERFSEFLCDPFHEPHQEEHDSESLLRNRMLHELKRETVPVMLHDDDLASMRWSVENRAPYLDKELVECLFKIPGKYLVQKGLPKYLLRQAGRDIVPREILLNPRKQGINAPVTSMIDFTDPDVKERFLTNSPFFEIVDRAKFEKLLGSEIQRNSESKFLFSTLAARLFMDHYHSWEV